MTVYQKDQEVFDAIDELKAEVLKLKDVTGLTKKEAEAKAAADKKAEEEAAAAEKKAEADAKAAEKAAAEEVAAEEKKSGVGTEAGTTTGSVFTTKAQK